MSLVALKLPPEDVPKLLLPYQQNWLRDKSGVKMWTKSRRIGASWCEAGDCALAAAEAKGENSFYIGYEKDMTRGFIQDAADWAKAYQLAASAIEEDEEIFRDGDEEKSILVFRLHFNSGFKIEALSSSPRNLRSRQGRVVIDEAAFHDDLNGLLKAAKALRIWGSRINIITTYNGIDNAYYDLEKDVLAGKLPYSRHFTTFEDALAQGLYRRICLVNGKSWTSEGETEWKNQVLEEFGDDADEELNCIPSSSGGIYFPRILVENCMRSDIPVLRLKLPDDFALLSDQVRHSQVEDWLQAEVEPLICELNRNLNSFYGMDFGRSGDLSYLLVGQELPNLVRRATFALELRNIPFEQQKQILFFVVDRLPRFQIGAHDARGNGQYLAEVAAQKYGFGRVHQIQLTNQWYSEWMPKYKSGLEDRKIELPASADLLQDHRQVVSISGVPKVPEGKKKKGSDGEQRHGDGAIACCLFWFASEQEPIPIEFESVGATRLAYQLNHYSTDYDHDRLERDYFGGADSMRF